MAMFLSGIGADRTLYTLSTPEINGLIEFSVLGGRDAQKDIRTGKEVYTRKPIEGHIDFFVKRI